MKMLRHLFTTLLLGTVLITSSSAVPVLVIYQDAANTGFFDPTVVTPAGGNPGTTLGQQRRIALEYAALRWGAQIQGSIPIKVRARWVNSGNDSTLATCSAINYFTGGVLPVANVEYPSALADQLTGEDLATGGTSDDMIVTCNSYYGTNGTDPTDTRRWYYGLDGNAPLSTGGQPWFDFVGVTLHEIGHGLGFLSYLNADGTYVAASGTIWDSLMSDSAGTAISSLSAAQRATAVVGSNLFNNGAITVSMNAGNRARLHAPATFAGGSSRHHYDEATFSGAGSLNELMTPVASFPTQVFGSLCLGALRDMGYVMADTLPPTSALTFPAPGASYKSANLAGTPIAGTATDTSTAGEASAVGIIRLKLAFSRLSDGRWYHWVNGVFDSAIFDHANHNKLATLDNLPIATGSRAWSLPFPAGLPEGQYQVSISAVDQLEQGHAYAGTTFTIDNTSPSAAITSLPASLSAVVYDFEGTTDGAGVNHVNAFIRRNSDGSYWNGTGWGATVFALSTTITGSTWAVDVPLPTPGASLANGSYNFIAVAVDAAGNQQQVDFVVTVNYTAPAMLAATHRDFSNTNQAANAITGIGTNGFHYGYYDTTGTTGTFSTTSMTASGSSWSGIQGSGTPAHTFQNLHPGVAGNSVVRRYRVNPGGAANNGEPPYTGPARIVGRFFDLAAGATDAFVTVDGGTRIGPTRIGPANPVPTAGPGSRMEGGELAFDFTAIVFPGSRIDFGATWADDGPNSDTMGFVAWIMTDDTPVPTNIVANTYHSPDTRSECFAFATDGRIGALNDDCFDTYPAPGHPHQFAGLLYLEQASGLATRFDTVQVDIGTQFTDGGDFAAMPRLFLLRHNSDPNTSDPTTDDRYVETSVVPVKLTNTAGRPYYEFDLAGIPADTRTGYGFAVVGPGSSTVRHISVSEISAIAARVADAAVTTQAPKFWEFQGHRYALSTTRGTWQDCENEAAAMGGHLVAVGSKEENEWIVNTFGDEQLYIGLTRPDGATPYAWSNGDALTFTSWGGGQPDGPADHWVTINCVGEFGIWHNTAIGGYPVAANYRGIIELGTAGASEAGFRLTVPGRGNVFGAGHNPAQTFPGPAAAAPGSGSIPPAYVRLTGSGSRKVVFSDVGGSASTGADVVGPDGGRHPSYPARLCDVLPVSPANGISGYKNLDNVPAMLGVFLSDVEPGGTPPPTLNFSNAALGQNFTDLSPQMGQVFFIGDGRTSSGAAQSFIVPSSATRLYLGFPDAYSGNNTLIYTGVPNGYSDNFGSFVARFSVLPDTETRVTNAVLPALGGQFTAAGGTGPYTWSILNGDLPPHLALLANGTLTSSGQPVVNGTYSFTVRVTDSAVPPVSGDKGFTVTILEPVSHPDGIVAWWPAQNASGDIIANHQGVRQNGAAYTAGKVGRAFQFDGVNDLVQVAHSPELNLPGELSIEGWIRPTANNPEEATILSKRSGDNNDVAYVFYLTADGRPSFASRSGGGAFAIATATTALPNNAWYHVGVSIGGGEARFYANGSLLHVAPFTAARPAVSEQATIGAAITTARPVANPVGAFPGMIDELSLYNRALTATEIAAIASAKSKGKERDDLALDYSVAVNSAAPGSANLPWVYGYLTPNAVPTPATFAPFTIQTPFQTGNYWSDYGANIGCNAGPGNVVQGTILVLPGQASVHPSNDGYRVAIRWVAPAAGTYAVAASFSRADYEGSGRQKDIHVFHNNAGLFSTTISAPTEEKNTTHTINVALGDTVDFIVGAGNDGYYYDSAGLAASIVPVTAIVPLPEVTTAEPTVYPAEAYLAAIVDPHGLETQLRFRYGTSPTLATFTETTPFNVGSTVSYSTQGTGPLSARTTYYFRAVAQSSAGTSYGAIASFTTTNSPPIALGDQRSVLNDPPGQSFSLDVRANDTDANGDTLTITGVTNGAHGSVVITGGGTTVSYTPAAGFFGAETFTYTVSDGYGGNATATVTVGVQRDYAAWAAAEGLSGGTSPTGDEDGDGVSNVFEFFHGLDPELGATAADRAALPVIERSTGTGAPTFLTYTYRRNLAASLVAVSYELASTLTPADWTPTVPGETTILSTNTANGTQVIRVKFPIAPGTDAMFVRIKLTL